MKSFILKEMSGVLVFLMVVFIFMMTPLMKSYSLLFFIFTLSINLISYSHWGNFILGMIYLGGVLVLMIYVCSLSDTQVLLIGGVYLGAAFLMFNFPLLVEGAKNQILLEFGGFSSLWGLFLLLFLMLLCLSLNLEYSKFMMIPLRVLY